MYSVVLLAAMTAGGESADLGRRGGCYGGGCYGGGFGGGCRGGGLLGGGGGLFGRKHGGGGCYGGGCYGGGFGGCHGGGYAYGGCYGSGHGGYGYGGGCYGGGAVIVGGGCNGSGFGHGGVIMGGGCYGSGMVLGGGGVIMGGGCTGGVIMGGGHMGHDAGKKEMEDKTKKNGDDKGAEDKGKKDGEGDKGGNKDDNLVSAGNKATIVVSLPVSARLSFNGQSVGTSTATERTFVSPELAAGRSYAYELRAEYQKGGRNVAVSKRVQVEPGKTVRVDLNETTALARR